MIFGRKVVLVLSTIATRVSHLRFFFFFQAEDGIRDLTVTGVQTCALPIGIGVCDRLMMLQYSPYSVISPGGCASILWKSQDKKEVAAESLNLTADRLQKLGLVDEVIEEPLGGAHRDPSATAASLKAALVRHLDELDAVPRDQLRAARAEKIAGFGVFAETAA